MECRDHQGEGKHQEHLDLDNVRSDQFIVIINLGKHPQYLFLFSSPWPELSYRSDILDQYQAIYLVRGDEEVQDALTAPKLKTEEGHDKKSGTFVMQ